MDYSQIRNVSFSFGYKSIEAAFIFICIISPSTKQCGYIMHAIRTTWLFPACIPSCFQQQFHRTTTHHRTTSLHNFPPFYGMHDDGWRTQRCTCCFYLYKPYRKKQLLFKPIWFMLLCSCYFHQNTDSSSSNFHFILLTRIKII